MLRIFFLSLAVAVFGQMANPEPTFVSNIEGIKEYSLDNGMRLLLLQDNTQSNVVVNIVYKVGSRHEGYGEKGMAHLLEHMLFKSTENMGDIKKQLTDKGGNANGTTWYDRTNYYEIFPATDENLEWSIKMEADRMLNATILQSDLDKEFSVVRNEFEIGENDPGGVLMERIISTAFLWHNYGASTIGSKEDIERVNAKTLRVFYEKYYQPNNATLIIGGKFDEQKALQYVAESFGNLPKGKPVAPTYTVEPEQDGERFVELRRNGDQKVVAAAYHTTPYADKDYAALDALSYILTSDPSGYLYKALIDTKKASSIWSWQPTTRDASFMYFNLDVSSDQDFETAKNAFLNELDGISEIQITQVDVDRAKANMLKDIENIKNNTIGTVISLTEIIGAGDYKLGFMYRDNVEALTLQDVQRVAKHYFKRNNRTYGVFLPSDKEERVKPKEYSNESIAKMTEGYKGKELVEENLDFEATIANVRAKTQMGNLSNGFKFAHLRKPIKGQKVVANFYLPTGDEKSLSGKATSFEMMANMLMAGTKNKTKEQIKDELDKMKSSLWFSQSGQSLYISVSAYQEHLEPTMALLKECLTESIFPTEELEKLKAENKAQYETQLKDPQSIAFGKLAKIGNAYGKEHLFYPASVEENMEREAKLSIADVKSFYENFVGAEYGYGTLVGDLDEAKVKSLLESTFGSIKGAKPYTRIERKQLASSKNMEKVVTPDKENAVAAGLVNFQLNESDPDYPAALVMNEIMGGGFITSRIPNRLREKEGISYGAGAFMNVPYSHKNASWGVFAFYNPTKVNEVEKALMEEIQRPVKEGFTQAEMDNAIQSWENSRDTFIGNDGRLMGLINSELDLGKKIEEFDEIAERVKKVKVSDLQKVYKKYIKPENLSMIMVGDFEKK